MLALAAAAGFVSLSYEMIWYRAYGYVSQSAPGAFGLVLGWYLVGIALGSLASRRLCRDDATGDRRQLRTLGGLVFLANALSFVVVPAVGWANLAGSWRSSLALVAIAAGLLGATLPLLCHFGIAPDDRAGTRLSYVYLANIVGSSAGSLVTGFVVMDLLTTRQTAVLLGWLGLALFLGAMLSADLDRGAKMRTIGLAAIVAVALPFAATRAYDHLFEHISNGEHFTRDLEFTDVSENRHGVIAVANNGSVYGGGAYDGVVSTSLVDDKNLIVRAYAVPALHPAPRRVLVVGLATGAWAQVLANDPDVEHLVAIEINPGYLDLIARYPEVRSLLANPKVEIVIDDGRRYLARHPEQTFDVIVMNTTWHWRSNATNLLSREFLELARQNLRPNGLLYYNTTFDDDAMKTAVATYPYALRFINFMAVSDAPIAPSRARFAEKLRAWTIDGRPVFDLDRPLDRRRYADTVALFDTFERLEPVSEGFETRERLSLRLANARVITDDNMLSEWWSKAAP